MGKIFLKSCYIICLISTLCFISSANKSVEASNAEKNLNYNNEISLASEAKYYVYTPNNTAVLVYKHEEMTQAQIFMYDSYMDSRIPDAKRISSSSNKYNCHSYAWYNQSTTNEYFMPDPSNYYTDYSYEETTTPKVGDIICYFSSTGYNFHSGIIIGKNTGVSNNVCGNSNLYQVRSKWGYYGLYEHRGDQCPYTSTYGGNATYVKYYTLHNHIYNLNYKWKSDTLHYATCICNKTTTMGHVISTNSYNSNKG